MKIYLDVCCLNRPFDDQTNSIIHLESEAIIIIVSLCEKGDLELVSSEIVDYEIDNIPDKTRKNQLKLINSISRIKTILDKEIITKANYLESSGIKAFDALHIASAEKSADIFLTVDNKLLKKAKMIKDLKIEINNPVSWVEKEMKDDYS